MSGKRAPKHFFSKNASVNMPRTRFDMSFVNTTAITADYLYPVYCQMVLPGDSWNLSVSNFIRMISPIDVPMMDNLYCDYHFWFVPFRLVWKNTKYFFGEQDRSPDSDIDYTIPQISFDSTKTVPENYDGSVPFGGLPQCGSIYDYFGIPIQGTDKVLTGSFKINALPLRAFNLIYDDWYRDEQRCDYLYYNDGDEETTADKYFLPKRGKRFDYFTSSLLEPQLGEPVDIPLGSFAPVIGNGLCIGLDHSLNKSSGGVSLFTNQDGFVTTQTSLYGAPIDSSDVHGLLNAGNLGLTTDPTKSGMVADLSNASAATVASLRQAFQMQAYQEINARGGSRMVEYIYNQYGVIQPDIYTRPEYLGGAHQRLSVQPIVQQSSTDNVSPQGNLTGIIYGGHADHAFVRSFTEHGFIIGIMNIYSDLTYYQGLDRMWSIQTPLDIPLPVFANLTDEELKKKELVLTGNPVEDEKTYGYVERYSFAKYAKNTLTSIVRPNAPLTIGQWSLAQHLSADVKNTSDFIESNTPISRIEAVNKSIKSNTPISRTEAVNKSDGSNNPFAFIVNQKFSGNVVRCLPAYSDPMKWFMRT